MSRYTGPAFRKARRYGISLLENGKEFAKGKKRTTAPGQNGAKKVKLSDYGQHLYEKQKIRNIYGVNERQFKRLFEIARKTKGVTGTIFLQILESRLDNVVYRIGWATTRRQARQLVSHAHVIVNGKKVDIASYLVSKDDVIELRPSSKNLKQINESLAIKKPANWISLRDNKATILRMPERSEINQEVKESFVVEFYSK